MRRSRGNLLRGKYAQSTSLGHCGALQSLALTSDFDLLMIANINLVCCRGKELLDGEEDRRNGAATPQQNGWHNLDH